MVYSLLLTLAAMGADARDGRPVSAPYDEPTTTIRVAGQEYPVYARSFSATSLKDAGGFWYSSAWEISKRAHFDRFYDSERGQFNVSIRKLAPSDDEMQLVRSRLRALYDTTEGGTVVLQPLPVNGYSIALTYENQKEILEDSQATLTQDEITISRKINNEAIRRALRDDQKSVYITFTPRYALMSASVAIFRIANITSLAAGAFEDIVGKAGTAIVNREIISRLQERITQSVAVYKEGNIAPMFDGVIADLLKKPLTADEIIQRHKEDGAKLVVYTPILGRREIAPKEIDDLKTEFEDAKKSATLKETVLQLFAQSYHEGITAKAFHKNLSERYSVDHKDDALKVAVGASELMKMVNVEGRPELHLGVENDKLTDSQEVDIQRFLSIYAAYAQQKEGAFSEAVTKWKGRVHVYATEAKTLDLHLIRRDDFVSSISTSIVDAKIGERRISELPLKYALNEAELPGRGVRDGESLSRRIRLVRYRILQGDKHPVEVNLNDIPRKGRFLVLSWATNYSPSPREKDDGNAKLHAFGLAVVQDGEVADQFRTNHLFHGAAGLNDRKMSAAAAGNSECILLVIDVGTDEGEERREFSVPLPFDEPRD